MNIKNIKYIAIIIFISCFICGNPCFAVEKVQIAKQKVVFDIENELYTKAQFDLNKDFYQIYRIVERLSRANKLDEYSWRIVIPGDKNPQINAFAQQGNTILIKQGLMDVCSGRISVLAGVIGHEMAHEILRHNSRGTKDFENILKNIDEFKKSYAIKTETLVKDTTLLGSAIGSMANYYVQEKNKEEIEEIKKKIEDLEQEYLSKSRKMEHDADMQGLIYTIKAGFVPEDVSKIENIFQELLGENNDVTTHPTHQNRIWEFNNALKTLDLKKLREEGRKNIAASKTLTYEKSSNVLSSQKSIRINSKYASYEDLNKPFRQLFGK